MGKIIVNKPQYCKKINVRLGNLTLAFGRVFIGVLLIITSPIAKAQQTYDLQLANKTFPGNGTMTVDVQIQRTAGSSNFTMGQVFTGTSDVVVTHNNDGTGAGQMDATSVALHANTSSYFLGQDLTTAGQITAQMIRSGSGPFTVTNSFQSILTFTYTLGKPTTGTDQVTMAFTSGSTDIKDGSNTSQTQGTLTGFTNEALPVELTSFLAKWGGGNIGAEGSQDASNIQLTWNTAMELDNSHFEVERSLDGQKWEMIAEVEGNGNTTEAKEYAYNDEGPWDFDQYMAVYYRLKQVDFDGSYAYSGIQKVQFEKLSLTPDIRLFPNPAQNRVNIATVFPISQVQVLDLTGKVVGDFGTQKEIDVAHLSKGTYLIKFMDGDNLVTEKLSIER